MKIDRIITSVNANPNYLTFAPTLCKVWRHLHDIDPMVAYIKCENQDLDYVCQEYLRNSGCNLFVFDKLDIDHGIQSKITRMYMAATFEDSNNLIVDIDMFPMSTKFLESYQAAEEGHLVKFGDDHFSFQRDPDIGKWPMHGTAGYGATLKEIINPDDLSYEDLLRSWSAGFPQDPRSNVLNSFHNFSDESLLKCLTDRWEGKDATGFNRCSKILRTDIEGDYDTEPVYGRLCRAHHHQLDNIDLSRYFEAHGPRPFNQHPEWYQQLFNFIGLKDE